VIHQRQHDKGELLFRTSKNINGWIILLPFSNIRDEDNQADIKFYATKKLG